MDKKLSIIIPVYNNKKGIKDCVESIEYKASGAVEIIIIDDGSGDGTLEVIRNLKKCYSNIVFLAQEHKGVVSARLLGLSVAKGEYIWFVDSDDRLCKGAVDDVLYDISSNGHPDICVFNHYNEENGNRHRMDSELAPGYYERKQIKKEIFPYAFHDFRQSHFRQPVIDGFLWNKVWKKKLIAKAICKDKRISLFEDAISVFMAVAVAGTIYKSSDARYIYVKGNSATSDYRKDYFYNTALCARLLRKELDKLPNKQKSDGKRGANAFITERLIVSIVREMRYRKDYVGIYRFVAGELKKYRLHKRLSFEGLPVFIKIYLFLLKVHLYIPALIIARVMV